MAGKTWSAEDIERWKKSQVNNAQSFVSENKYEEIPAIKPANDNKQSTNSRWTAEDVAKRALNKSTSTSISPNTGTQIDVDRLIATDYKMSKDERKEARKYAKDWMKDYTEKLRKGEISQTDAANDLLDVNSDYYKIQQLENKSKPLSAFSIGVLSGMPFVDFIADIGAKNGNLTAELFTKNRDNAQTQNKGANIAGNLAGSAATYSALSPTLQGISALNNATGKAAGALAKIPGLSKVGTAPIQNILNDTTVDVVLDTLPNVAIDFFNGKSVGEVAKNASANIGMNLAGNIIGEGLSGLSLKMLDKLPKNLRKGVENSAENATGAMESTDTGLKELDVQTKAEAPIETPEVAPVSETKPTNFTGTGKLKKVKQGMEKLVGWYGDDASKAELVNFNNALAEFEETGSMDAFNRMMQSATIIDNGMQGKTYTTPDKLNKNGSLKRKGVTYTYGDSASVEGVLEDALDALDEIYSAKNVDIPQTNTVDENQKIPSTSVEKEIPQVEKTSSEFTFGREAKPEEAPVAKEEIPALTMPELKEGEYVTRTATNTMAKSEAFRDNPEMMAVLQDEINSGNMTFKTVTEDESLSKAREALKKDPDGEFKRLLNSDGWTESKDVDEAMMFIKASGDDNDFDNVRRMARKFGAQGHEAATVLQALAKYSRTSEGSIAKAQVILDNQIKKWAKNNPKEAQTSKQIVDEFLQARKGIEMNLQMFGKKITDATDDQIKNAILDIVKRYNLESKFDESNINFIIRLIRGGDVNDIKSSVESIMATKKYGISDETIAQVRAFFDEADQYGADSKKRVELENKAFALLANDVVTPSWRDKWDAWRYFAMLHKPTTHERNLIGNAVMYGISEIKDELSALVEATVDAVSKNGIERTKTTSFGFTSDKHKALIKAANKYADDVAYRQLVGSKYNAKAGIQSQSKAFRKGPGKFIQKAVDFNSDLLEKEDMLFLRTKYGRALAGYLKANGADASIFTKKDDASKKLLEKASEYAIKEAKRVTFHEDSLLADLLTDTSKKLKDKGDITHTALNMALEGLVPFKKTPINIVKTGLRYSPIGVANSIKKAIIAVFTGKYTAAEVIDSLVTGLSGTGIMLLGARLGSMGLVRGNGTGDEKQDAFDKLHGEQNYSLQIGDHNYTIDWLAPSVLPLLVGVELQKAWGDKGNDDVSALLNAIAGIAEPVIETSMLQGVSDMLNSIQYADSDAAKLAGVTTDLATGYISQGLPTSLSGVARSIDNTRRNAASDKQGVVGQLDYFKNSAMNKIPFLSKNNPEYRDEWGRTQENFSGANGNVLGNLAYQFLNPGYYSKDNATPVDSYLQKLSDSPEVDTNVFPSKIDRSVEIEGNTVRMNGEEYSKAQKIAGETSYDLIGELKNNAAAVPKEVQAEIIPSLYGTSKAIAYNKVMDKPISQTYDKNVKVYNELGAEGLVNYLIAKKTADVDGDGTLKKEDLKNELQNQGFTGQQIPYLLKIYNKKW